MSSDERTPNEVQSDNLAHFMDRGPGLSWGYGIYVVARDRVKGRVLLGGLGAMGVGQMWWDDTGSRRDYPGWEDAPERIAPERGPW